ncbi:proprotein convertase P-domain-containing protein, partial [Planktosalinus lacus]|uniref:proprotein convertase P-domain-containing protein n=1 Tax=Planktosalinus lacus TaxID=1526573 RepID=UPI00166CE47A
VTLTVEDEEGNTDSVIVTVTVVDDMAPVIACQGEGGNVNVTETASPGTFFDENIDAVSTITVTDDFVLTDVNIGLDISHTWVSDLEISLTSPEGTTIVLLDPDFCLQDNVLATLDDDAATSGDTQCATSGPGDPPGTAAISGTFTPTEALSAFNGESSMGDWTLTVTDGAAGDDGVLNSWTLDYSYFSNTVPPLEVVLVEGTATVQAEDFLNVLDEPCGYTVTVDGEDFINFTCADIGEHQFEIVVTDASGNSSTCMASVEVVDPSLYCELACSELENPVDILDFEPVDEVAEEVNEGIIGA